MKRSILFTAAILYAALSYSQSGINTLNPRATLEVAASPADPAKTDGVIAPKLTGDQLKAKDNLYDADQTGTHVTAPGYYCFDGTVWVPFKSAGTSSPDATRFIDGMVYVWSNSTVSYLAGLSI